MGCEGGGWGGVEVWDVRVGVGVWDVRVGARWVYRC